MGNDVLITITGMHEQDGQRTDPVVTTARGRYFFRNGHHYLLYEEPDEDKAGTPAKEADAGTGTKSVIRFDDGVLEVTRKGSIGTKMHFEKGKRSLTHYVTPLGALDLEIETDRIDFVNEENAITVEAFYSLHADGEKLQESRVKIEVLPYPFL